MASNDNFAQDVTENQVNGNGENGGGDGQEHNSADALGRDDDRKLLVGGLSWETTDKELRDHFSAYGEIESINVKTDPNTGRSRGVAFIVFKAPDSIDKVMAAGDHTINNQPTAQHWSSLKRVLRYLKATIKYKLSYKNDEENIIGYCDADWASHSEDRRSCTGYLFLFQGAAISWCSKRQTTIALSSTEAEWRSGSVLGK